MKLEHFHDFYFLQALKAGLSSELAKDPSRAFSRSVEKLSSDVDEAMDEIIPNIALRTFVYLYAACLGESRHAREAVAKDFYMPQAQQMHRSGLYEQITNYRPTPQNIDVLVKIFDQEWKSGFGGQAWCKIAKALHMYFTSPPSAFIDYVIDLEHNGGTAFNKTDSKDTLFFIARYPTRLNFFLDYKFSQDILTTRPEFVEELKLTPRVYKLVNRFSTIFHRKEVNWVTPRLDTLDDYLVEWGDESLVEEKKWCEWVDVSYKNEPYASIILEQTGIENIDPSQLTAKQLVYQYKQIVKKALQLAGEFLTPRLEKQLKTKIKRAEKYNQQYTMVEKKETTYQALPITIKHIKGYEYLAEILVPFDGYGTPTQNGFSCKIHVEAGKISAHRGHIANGYSLQLHTNQQNYYFVDKNLESFLD
jgi:hypothetical protein